jgi:hypothetical protein
MPTISEIIDYGEDKYYSIMSSLVATPFDMMAQLHLAGIDYETVTEFQLFCNIIALSQKNGDDMSIVFGDLDLSRFTLLKNNETGALSLVDAENSYVIDSKVHRQICHAIRTILFAEKNTKKAGNKETKAYLLERAVAKLKRQQKKPYKPFLENVIIALTSTEQSSYKLDEAMKLTIYEFNSILRQTQHIRHHDQVMGALYAGTIKREGLSDKDLSWIST